jgi:recombination protein RecA
MFDYTYIPTRWLDDKSPAGKTDSAVLMSQSIAELRIALERRTRSASTDVWREMRGLQAGADLDGILGTPGIPQGRLTEIFGGASSGKTSAAFALLAACTGAGSFAAYVDPCHAFFAPVAADAGIALLRLLVVRPSNVSVALRAVDALVRCGACAAVVFDCTSLGDALRTHHCARLASQAEKTATALIVLSNGNIPALASFASLRLRASGLQPLWQSGSDGSARLSGCAASLEVMKSKLAAPGRSAHIRMTLPGVAASWPVAEAPQRDATHGQPAGPPEAALERQGLAAYA